MPERLFYTFIMQAPPLKVWDALTDKELMKEWMAEPEMKMEVLTDWTVGGPILIKAFHHINFENHGTVLQFKPGEILEYNYRSSISRLPDIPENRTTLLFTLEPINGGTYLKLVIKGFPTVAIYKHVDFYWKTTLNILRKQIEENSETCPSANINKTDINKNI